MPIEFTQYPSLRSWNNNPVQSSTANEAFAYDDIGRLTLFETDMDEKGTTLFHPIETKFDLLRN